MNIIKQSILFISIVVIALFGMQSLSTAHAEAEQPLAADQRDAPLNNLAENACTSLIQAPAAGYTPVPGTERCADVITVSAVYFTGQTIDEHTTGVGLPDSARSISEPVESTNPELETALFVLPVGDEIRVRQAPVDGKIIDVVAYGDMVEITEPSASARDKIGVEGEWITVRTASGLEGYTAAWLYTVASAASTPAAHETTPSPSEMIPAYGTATLFLVPKGNDIRVRTAPVDGDIVDLVAHGEVVQVVETVPEARSKIGVSGQWIAIRTLDGTAGYTAAWLYDIAYAVAPEIAAIPAVTLPNSPVHQTSTPVTMLIRAESDEVNVRQTPINGEIIATVGLGELVEVVEPFEAASAKIGVPGQWVEVRTSTNTIGYTAAWLYSIETTLVETTLIGETTPDTVANTLSATSTLSAQASLLLAPLGNDIRVRAMPVDGAVVGTVTAGELVEVTETVTDALAKIGINGAWIAIRTPDGVEGYTAAWLYEIAQLTAPPENTGFEPLDTTEGADTLVIPAAEQAEADPIAPLDDSIAALGIPEPATARDNTAGATVIMSPGTIAALETVAETNAVDATPETVGATDADSLDASALAAGSGEEPEIEIFNPVMPVSIDIVDTIEIESAELAINDVPLMAYTAPPFEYDLDTLLLSDGQYRLTFTITNPDGMQITDDMYFEVEIEQPTPLPGAVTQSTTDTPGILSATADTTTATEPLRRIVTIDGVERPFDLEFSVESGLVPAEEDVPTTRLAASDTPETLLDVITAPIVTAIPAPVYDFLMVERPQASAIIILIMVLILIPQGLFTIYWMTYTWNNPEAADQYRSPKTYTEPQYSFTALLPARREEKVIKDTIRAVDRINYPDALKEILILIRDDDDDETIRAAQEAIAELGKDNIHLVTFTDGPRNKPNGLNRGLRRSTKDVVCIFDAEDEPHPDVYNIVNTVMVRDNADVVQSGVQLMNFKSSWFSVFNVLEYFFWFRSGLHAFTRQFKVTPLGGNTVFFKRQLMERIGGWDEIGLTEDADVGLRLTQLGAKIQIVYEAEHATREETPDTVDSFIKQRTRWNQGFYQIFFKGDWLRLPTMTQKIVALYILLNSILQAAMILFIPVGAYIALTQQISVPLALVSYIPIYILIIQLVISLIGIREFAAAYNERLPMFFSLRMALFYYPYQLLLSVSALRAMLRMVTRQGAWEKTSHSNLHRQEQLSGVA